MAGAGGGPLAGRRILITGAARGIGEALARRLYERDARVALAGLEPELLARVAADCGDAPWRSCDVSDRTQVDEAVAALAGDLGGLDVVVANAGVAGQLPLVGGEATIFERTIAVNLLGVYYTLRAAGPQISHPRGYALAVASLSAAAHAPLLSAYNASKAGVEALGNTARIELRPSGARVGVAYFGEIDTDMLSRGYGTAAASKLPSHATGVATVEVAVDALERGIARRSRRVVAPRWVAWVLPRRMLVQRLVELGSRRGVEEALRVARTEAAPLTTPQDAVATEPGGPDRTNR